MFAFNNTIGNVLVYSEPQPQMPLVMTVSIRRLSVIKLMMVLRLAQETSTLVKIRNLDVLKHRRLSMTLVSSQMLSATHSSNKNQQVLGTLNSSPTKSTARIKIGNMLNQLLIKKEVSEVQCQCQCSIHSNGNQRDHQSRKS